MIEVMLSRIVLRDGASNQYIFLSELDGPRSFPIVIGQSEALEIHRVVHGVELERPLTHQLAYAAIQALGGAIESVDIVDLKKNTFYARIQLVGRDETAGLDARPSDAIALALRAKCRIRVAEDVLERALGTSES
jgi:hypothetical protein